jgi:HAD superfamily hydrolase (TIGR01549 family)
MRFNRAIGPVKVLSFDLDDTLYDNRPIIKQAVKAMLDYLSEIPQWQAQGKDYWRDCRRATLELDETLEGDVTRWRHVALRYGFSELGFNEPDIAHHVEAAYHAFATARSQITVSDEVIALLHALKQKYTLIAITNGNVEVEKFNLNGIFELVLMAGRDGLAKPEPALFSNACQQLNVMPKQILHIGDSLDSDIQGALNAGCYSAWLPQDGNHFAFKGLADVELTSIADLRAWL